MKKYSEDNWVLYYGDKFMEHGRYSDEAAGDYELFLEGEVESVVVENT